MLSQTRRRFLADVGRGMFVASIGSSLAFDMQLASAFDAEGSERITFGSRDRLVDLLQSTAPDRVLPLIVAEIRNGTSLKDLTAAAALANGRAFAGEDYIGFHTLMALRPALAMSEELTGPQAALPLLKVLYRNSRRIQEAGVNESDGLHPLVGESSASGGAEAIREAVHRLDREAAEQALRASIGQSPQDGFNDLLATVGEGVEVHRTVLAARAWDMISLVGEENAATMLRQSLRYCLKNEDRSAPRFADVRATLPRVMDQFHLEDREWGTKSVDDAWVLEMMNTLWTSKPEQASEAVAAAIAEGVAPQRIMEAIALATNQLVLCDAGRPKEWADAAKPVGSVHGDSIGVHASDSMHAWRTIAEAANTKQRNAAIVLAAYQASQDKHERGGAFDEWEPRPHSEHRDRVKSNEPASLLAALNDAIKAGDQDLACAITARYGEADAPEAPVFAILRDYATSQDGALHAEKYYMTVRDNFRMSSPAHRWRHAIALARVTASEYGRPAPGFEEAQGLLQG